MTEWKEYKLGELTTINDDSINGSYSHEEIEYLDTGSITKGKIESLQNVKLKEAPSRARRLVKKNDIIYSTVRPIQRHYGYIENNNPKLVVSTGFAVIRADEKKVDPKYLYHLLSSDDIVNYLDTVAEGSTSTYPSLRPEDIAQLDVVIPSIKEQTKIADILSSLDDKIDLLHRQNKTLEALAETLFRQWFVEQTDESYEEIPLSEIALHLKQTVIPAKNPTSIFKHYSLPAFDDGSEPKKELGKDILSGKYQVVSNSILISKLNPRTPRIWGLYGSIEEENAICSTEFQIVKPKDNLYYEFIYCYLKSNQVLQELSGAASGTSGSHQRVNPEDIFNLSFPNSPKKLIERFHIATYNSFEKIKINHKQILTLTQLRDTLLPKLMSGEVRVKN